MLLLYSSPLAAIVLGQSLDFHAFHQFLEILMHLFQNSRIFVLLRVIVNIEELISGTEAIYH